MKKKLGTEGFLVIPDVFELLVFTMSRVYLHPAGDLRRRGSRSVCNSSGGSGGGNRQRRINDVRSETSYKNGVPDEMLGVDGNEMPALREML